MSSGEKGSFGGGSRAGCGSWGRESGVCGRRMERVWGSVVDGSVGECMGVLVEQCNTFGRSARSGRGGGARWTLWTVWTVWTGEQEGRNKNRTDTTRRWPGETRIGHMGRIENGDGLYGLYGGEAWGGVLFFEVVEGAEAEADEDVFSAYLKVELAVEPGEKEPEGYPDGIPMDVNFDVGGAEDGFALVEGPYQVLEEFEFLEQLVTEGVFAFALCASYALFAGCIEYGEADRRVATVFHTPEFEHAAKLQI